MNGQGFMITALKRVGAVRLQADPQIRPAPVAEYLYVPCVRAGYGHEKETRWVQRVPIVKKTASRIYYTSDTADWRKAVVTPGCISRELFEATGRILIPGDRHRDGPAGRFFFATREAAESNLGSARRERADGDAALIRELRRAMASAHPDHGGTADQFIQARHRYQAALRQAR